MIYYTLFKTYELIIFISFYLNRVKKNINSKFKSLNNNKILFYNRNKVCSRLVGKNLSLNNINNIKFNYDYFVCLNYNDQIKCCSINHINNEICDYKFLLVNLKFSDKKIDITSILKNKNFYLYIVNNKLFDEIFLKWFSLLYFKIDYLDLTIEILDDKLNNIIINRDQYIILEKNKYIIK